MKEPIIVKADDGMHIYRLAAQVEMHLEAIDVRNNVYEAYDAQGHPLSLTTEFEKPPGWLGHLFPIKTEVVQLVENPSVQPNLPLLRELLVAELERAHVALDDQQKNSLPDLINVMIATFGYLSDYPVKYK